MIKSLTQRLVALTILLVFSNGAIAGGCYESSIQSPTPFMGNDGEVFKLIDGSVWEVKYEYEYMYEYYPSVIVCPDRGKLVIGDKKLNVELLSTAKGSGASLVIHGKSLRKQTSKVVSVALSNRVIFLKQHQVVFTKSRD